LALLSQGFRAQPIFYHRRLELRLASKRHRIGFRLTTFRINTYEKRGEGGPSPFWSAAVLPPLLRVSLGTAPVAQGGVRGALRLFQDSMPTSGAAPMKN